MSGYSIKDPKVESSEVNEAAVDYGLSKQQMAAMLGISDKTFYNLMKAETFDVHSSDRFLFIKNILQEGSIAFNGSRNFTDWLHTEQSVLDGQKPVDLLSSLNGAQEVLATITRIKQGIFA